MKTRLRLRISKRENATEENERDVPVLALKNYDSLVMIAKRLDAHSLVKLGKTSKTMHDKLKLLKGMRIPFDMGEVHYYSCAPMNPWAFVKIDASHWSLAVASKIKERNPLFVPFVTRVVIYANVTGEILEKFSTILNRMKAKRVNAMTVTLVHPEAWEDLKDFIERFKIDFVHIYDSAIPEEHQNSRVLQQLPYLDHNGVWSYEYLMNTKRPIFVMGQISFETFTEILKRWHTEKLKAWEMQSAEFDFFEKCKENYSTVTVRQKTDIPETRPLLCDMGERNCIATMALLLKDGRVLFIKCANLVYEANLCIQEAEEEKYPPVFKKILGIGAIQKKRKRN